MSNPKMALVDVVTISKLRAAMISAGRTFLQAAIPAAVLAWQASDGSLTKAVVLAVLGSAFAAGVAAVMRVVSPPATDKAGVAVR